MGARQEVETVYEPSNPSLECELYTQYLTSAGSADQSLRELVQYEAGRQVWCALPPRASQSCRFSKTFGIVGCLK